MTETAPIIDTDYFLDITTDVCPMTFVRTKLLIERMEPGQTAKVRLQNTEPLENVPRSVREIGHEVLSMEPEDPDGPADGVHLLILKSQADNAKPITRASARVPSGQA